MDPLSTLPASSTVPVPPPPGDDEAAAGGAASPGAGPLSDAPAAAPTDANARNLAVAAHLSALVAFAGIPSFVGPLVLWLLRRDDDPFVAEHARDAVNFNISALLYIVGLIALTIVTFGLGLVVLVPVLLVGLPAWLIVTIVAAVRASEGRSFRYPLTIQFIR